MASKRNEYDYKYYCVLVILYSIIFTGLVCVFGDDKLDNINSWYLWDTRNILRDSKDNFIVSPKNLAWLLKPTPLIDVRFGKEPEPFLILAASKKILNSERLESFFGSKIQEMPGNDKGLLQAINDWANNSTDHKFPRVLDSVAEIKNLQLAIFNILQFKETLQVDFKYSVNGLFHVSTQNAKKIPSIEATDYFDYLDSQILDAKVLRLPYSNNLSMYVFLPHTKTGLDELLNNLGYELFKRMQWMMEKTRVNVLLPKFMYHFQTNCKDYIKNPSEQHNFEKAYSEFANVRLDNNVNIFQISTISFDVNDKDVQNSKIMQDIYEKFHVDRPFAFYIEENNTGDIMYIGKVMNPTQ